MRVGPRRMSRSSNSGFNPRARSAARSAGLLTNIGAVAIVALFTVFTPRTAAAVTYSISSGSTTPNPVTRGQAVAIKSNFNLSAAGTVAIYFEIRNSSNVLMADQSWNSQVFSAGQVRTFTWNFTVPTTWPAGTYRVAAGIFTSNWSTTLQWASSSSFGVSTSTSTSTTTTTTTTTTTSSGHQFYVDNVSGSDSNSGTSSTAPWKSLAKVNAATFHPGDVINFKRGSVWTGNLKVRTSGTSTSVITYQAYGSGAAPQIKNPGVSYGHAMDVTGSYNVISGFLFTDAHEAGVKIGANAVRNIVAKSEITRAGTGVMVSGQYNLVTNNYVHDLKMIVNDSAPYTDYGAVCFWLEANNNEVSYNRGINCRASSYDFGYDGGFVEVWQSGDNSYIHHNYAQNTNGFFELGAGGSGSAQNIRVAYNVIVNVTGQGSGTSVCFNTGSYNISVGTFKFENNTFVSTAGHSDAYRVFGCRTDLSALQLRNNIFYSDIQIANAGSFTHSNNVYYMVNMVNGSGVGYSVGTGEKKSNPLFVNMSGGDFHLQLTSPAIDAGIDAGYKKDFQDTPVPQSVFSLLPDIGAYEYKR
jgi:hypothetical protein